MYGTYILSQTETEFGYAQHKLVSAVTQQPRQNVAWKEEKRWMNARSILICKHLRGSGEYKQE